MFQFKIISALSDFKKIKAVWKGLESQGNYSVFSSFEWYLSWWESCESCGITIQPYILICLDKNTKRVVGIAPLMFESPDTLVFLSKGPADYQEFLIDEEDKDNFVIKELLRFIFQRNPQVKISLGEIRENSNFFRKISEIKELREKLVDSSVCPCLNLSELSDGFEHQAAWRKLKKMQLLGEISTSLITDPKDLLTELPIFKSYFFQRWKNRSDSAFFFEKFDDIFMHNLCQGLEWGICWLFKLSLNLTPIAYYFGFFSQNSYLFYRSAYHPDFWKYSPGHILLQSMLRTLKKNGIGTFDFLRGEYSYKYHYSKERRKNYAVYLDN